MHCHKRYFVVGILIFTDVHIAKKRHVLQEIIQSEYDSRKVFSGLLGLLLSFLHKHRYGVDKFINVGKTGLSLDGTVRLKEGIQTAVIRNSSCKLKRISSLHQNGKPLHHFTECLDFRNLKTNLEKARFPLPCELFERLQRRGSDTSRRLVDHPFEGLVVIRIHT